MTREAVRLAAWFTATLLACLTLPVLAHGSVVTTAICRTFGPYCSQALRVARCESMFNVYARNGSQYGLFQVSAQWRRDVPGFAWDAWSEARHAYRVFQRVGYRWSPTWSCRP